ncbi:MAG: hypothetical protein DMG49_07755 [Acidobacteria bacterium]|nr:MAG: hypothetical protein DMG49_07755 [Acidobacteriota bacterium]
MVELFRDLGIVISALCLPWGVYLLRQGVSLPGHDAPGSLILGSVLCALALFMGFSSIRSHYSLRQLKRRAQEDRQKPASHNSPEFL